MDPSNALPSAQLHLKHARLKRILQISFPLAVFQTTQYSLWGKIVYTDSILSGKIVYTDSILSGKTVYTDSILSGKTVYTDNILSGKIVYTDNILSGKIVYSDSILSGKVVYTDNILSGKTVYTDNILFGCTWYPQHNHAINTIMDTGTHYLQQHTGTTKWTTEIQSNETTRQRDDTLTTACTNTAPFQTSVTCVPHSSLAWC